MDVIKRMREGKCWILVCTEVMARGMDFKGIKGVINYDFPTTIQSYVHRIGRTGRAGREGFAVTYWTNEDGLFLKALSTFFFQIMFSSFTNLFFCSSLANVFLQSGSPVPEWILKLPKPSQLKRRQMGKVKRGDEVNEASRIGKRDAIKKRDMVLASKRRKEKAISRKDESTSRETSDRMEWTGFNSD